MRIVLPAFVTCCPTRETLASTPTNLLSPLRPTPRFSEHFQKLLSPCPSIWSAGKRSLKKACSLSLKIFPRHRVLLHRRRPFTLTPDIPPTLPQSLCLPPPLPSIPNLILKPGGRYSGCIWKRTSFKAIRNGLEVSVTLKMRRRDSLRSRLPYGSECPRAI